MRLSPLLKFSLEQIFTFVKPRVNGNFLSKKTPKNIINTIYHLLVYHPRWTILCLTQGDKIYLGTTYLQWRIFCLDILYFMLFLFLHFALLSSVEPRYRKTSAKCKILHRFMCVWSGYSPCVCEYYISCITHVISDTLHT